jgi:S-adenosylmethionine hydrolase
MQVDGFGNLITNITRQMFEDARRGRSFNIMARGSKYRISKIDSLYAQDVEDLSLHADLQDGGGELLALFGSSGLLELAMRWGHASNMLHVRVTDPIRIEFR